MQRQRQRETETEKQRTRLILYERVMLLSDEVEVELCVPVQLVGKRYF